MPSPPRTRARYHAGMTGHSDISKTTAGAVPAKPSLDGLEDKWARQWDLAGVVQV
jgi:hypothetical protein